MKLMSLVTLVTLVSAPASAPRATEPTPFTITLQHVDKTWSAACAKGCKWDAVSVTCRNDCSVIVDDRGLRTFASGQFDAEHFAFVVEPDGAGWRARTLAGTAWIALGFRCPTPGCKAAITEHGVSGPTP